MSSLRAIVQTHVENMSESEVATAQKALAGTECSYCGESACENPVHAVLDELAVELLDEEVERRKEWPREPQP